MRLRPTTPFPRALQGVLASTQILFAPVTCAFISGGPEGGALRIAGLRLQGTLAGSVFGYMAVKLTAGSPVAAGVLLAAWIAAMQYAR